MLSPEDETRISSMRKGGKKLSQVKKDLIEFTKVGTTFEQI